jgi:hypothetical protein
MIRSAFAGCSKIQQDKSSDRVVDLLVSTNGADLLPVTLLEAVHGGQAQPGLMAAGLEQGQLIAKRPSLLRAWLMLLPSPWAVGISRRPDIRPFPKSATSG